jgi:rubrerythrin
MTEIKNVQDAIKTAIQMEQDGYSFYKKTASQTSSDMGRTLFETLATDELLHLDIFQKLFENTISKNEWNELVKSSKKYANIPVFPKDLKTDTDINPDANELDALRIAMDSEKAAIEYYTKIQDEIQETEIKDIIDEIINQEKNHYQLLEEEFNHINKTGFWFDLDYLGT